MTAQKRRITEYGNSYYVRDRALAELYKQESEKITFSQFKKNLGIKRGRPKKQNKTDTN